MSEIVHRHGRRMCRLLEQALERFPADQCAVAAAALDGWRSDSIPELTAVMQGVATELRLVAFRAEQDAHVVDSIWRATTKALLPPDTPEDVA